MRKETVIFIILAAVFLVAPYLSSITKSAGLTNQMRVAGLSPAEQQVVALVNGSQIYACDQELENITSQYPAFRAAGSEGANHAATWIETQLANLGVNVSKESFTFMNWTLMGEPMFVVDEDGNATTVNDQTVLTSFECEHLSWYTPDSGVFAGLVILPLPQAADRSEIGLNPINMTAWNAVDTTGKIVLIGREIRWNPTWQQTFVDKLSTQPPAAVVYTWWYTWMSFLPPFFSSSGGLPLGSLGKYYWDLQIPVGFVGYEDGLSIRNMAMSAPGLAGNVTIRSIIGNGSHYNVVGRIDGSVNPEKLVVVSGHYDTVMDYGFCDNGAGISGIVELARVLSEAAELGIYRSSYTLLFVALTGEELDLVGAVNYVAQHKSVMQNIEAVINLDCIGSDDLYVTQTDPSGGFDLDQMIVNCAQDLGVNITIEAAGGSDQEAFRIPYEVNSWYYYDWGINPGISDATPVNSSALIDSYPLFYNDLWNRGKPGWIHTSYDNSTSTTAFGWVMPVNLENHVRVTTLAVMRVSPNAVVPPSKVITVPDDYASIQEAIDNANDNDTIFVRQGTYYESISVYKKLNLTGEDRDTTVIDGNGSQVVVSLTASSNVTGFTIRNGGYGVEIRGPPMVPALTSHRIEGNRIVDNYYGGVLLQRCMNNTVANNTVMGNKLFGIHLSDALYNTLLNNTVMKNEHGITLYGNTNYNTFRNNSITGNTYGFGPIMRGDTLNYVLSHGIINDVDTSNTVNGKPIYYMINESDIEVPIDAGYVLLNNCTNITVQGCDLSNNLQGILTLHSNGTTIANNSLADNVHGIYVGTRSFNSSLVNNTVEDNFVGVYLGELTAFTTMRNNAINGSVMNFGLVPWLPLLSDASDLINDIDASNTLDGKPIIYWTDMHDQQVPENAGYVMLINSTDIRIEDLTLANNIQNIFIVASNSTTIANNSISSALYGIQAVSSAQAYAQRVYPFNITIINNTISDNSVGIRTEGNNNTVRGNKLYSNPLGIYLKMAHYGSVSQNLIVGNGEAWLGVLNPDTSIFNYSLWRLEFTLELRQLNVGGVVVGGSYNTIWGNTVTNNMFGLCIDQTLPGFENTFFSNNVINSTRQQAVWYPHNNWNRTYPTGGNFWSNYNGTDAYSGPYQNETGSDGIGDTPLIIIPQSLAEVLDSYPLMGPVSTFSLQTPTAATFDLTIVSNSTVSDLQLDTSKNMITFNVTGEPTMGGFCRVTIPSSIVNELWQGNLTVLVNGTPVTFRTWTDELSTYLYFTYQHSTKEVTILPELPINTALALLMTLSLVVSVLGKKRLSKQK